jgi:lysophospholipase L1-like esterase
MTSFVTAKYDSAKNQVLDPNLNIGGAAQYSTDSSGNVTGLVGPSGGALPANIRKSIGRHAFSVAGEVQSGGATNSTFQTMFSCPLPFYAIQVIYVNATAVDLSATLNCSVAPTAISSSRLGTGLTYTQLTFNSGALTQPPLVAAPNSATFDYTYVISDIMPVQSIAPTEGTEYKVLVRTFKLTAGIPYFDTSNTSSFLRTVSGSEIYSDQLTGSGDFTLAAVAALTADNGLQMPVGVIFHTVGGCTTVLCGGDSISAGSNSSSSVAGYPEYLKKTLLSTYGKNAGVIVCGKASSGSASIYKRMRTLVTAGARPRVCVFPIETRNDTGTTIPTVAQTHSRFAAAIQFTEFCADNDIIPIIMGPFPEASLGAAGVTAYTFFETQGPILAANFGGSYVSVLGLLSTGSAGSYGWAVAGDTGDNVHPTDQGYAKVAALLAPVVAKYL